MADDFGSARHWARELMESACAGAKIIVDATMGNGHDTLWLARNAPEGCRVAAFDIQPEAIERTRRRLAKEGVSAELICAGHERISEYIQAEIDLCAFNLGWLPGGNHDITTRADTTLAAVSAVAGRLAKGGLITICAYPGHAEGKAERAALIEWASALDANIYDVTLKCYLNQKNDPPMLIAIRRR